MNTYQSQFQQPVVYQPMQVVTPANQVITLVEQPVAFGQQSKQSTTENIPAINTFKQCLCLLPMLFAIFVLVMGIIIICKDVNPSTDFAPAKNLVQFVATNLQKKPIYEIVKGTQTATCEEGYETIVIGEFNQILSGCICSDGQIHTNAYCYLQQKLSSDCQLCNGQEALPYYYWTEELITSSNQNSPKVEKFCIKRNKNPVYTVDGKCPDGFIACYNNLCVANNEKCPLNNYNYEAYNTQVISKNGIVLQGNIYTFTSNATVNYQPIIEFTTAPDVPCWENDKFPKYLSGKYYPLDSKPAQGCGTYGSTSNIYFGLQAKLLVKQVYQYNSILEKVNALPYIAKYLNDMDTLSLMVERRIQMSKYDQTCQSIDSDKINQITEGTNKLLKWFHILSVALISLGGAMILGSILMKILKALGAVGNPSSVVYFIYFLIIITIIWGYVEYSYYYKRNGQIESDSKIFSNIINAKCFEQIEINNALAVVDSYARQQIHFYIKCWIAMLWALGGYTLFLLMLMVCKVTNFGGSPLENPWVGFKDE